MKALSTARARLEEERAHRFRRCDRIYALIDAGRTDYRTEDEAGYNMGVAEGIDVALYILDLVEAGEL